MYNIIKPFYQLLKAWIYTFMLVPPEKRTGEKVWFKKSDLLYFAIIGLLLLALLSRQLILVAVGLSLLFLSILPLPLFWLLDSFINEQTQVKMLLENPHPISRLLLSRDTHRMMAYVNTPPKSIIGIIVAILLGPVIYVIEKFLGLLPLGLKLWLLRLFYLGLTLLVGLFAIAPIYFAFVIK